MSEMTEMNELSIHVPSKIEWNMSGQFFFNLRNQRLRNLSKKKKKCAILPIAIKLLNGIYRFCLIV
jgi:hypothetical protein